jgi:hypothetical protein
VGLWGPARERAKGVRGKSPRAFEGFRGAIAPGVIFDN